MAKRVFINRTIIIHDGMLLPNSQGILNDHMYDVLNDVGYTHNGIEWIEDSNLSGGELNQTGRPIGPYPKDTRYDDIFQDLIDPTGISGFTFDGRVAYIAVNTELKNLRFHWNENGSPFNKILRSSEGSLHVYIPDDESEYVDNINTYSYADKFTIHFTLYYSGSSDGTRKSVSTNTTWVHPSIVGSNVTGILPTESEILAGSRHNIDSWTGFTVNPNTSGNDYAWFAVDKIQTAKQYTKWYISVDNYGTIEEGNLVKYGGIVVVNGRDMDVYIFSYSSEVRKNIKLS
jgi:hypothetical protein